MMSTGFPLFIGIGVLYATIGALLIPDVAENPVSLISVIPGIGIGVLTVYIAFRLRIAPKRDGGLMVYHFPRGSDSVLPGATVRLVRESHDILWFLDLWVPAIHDEKKTHTLTAWGQYAFLGGKWFARRRARILQSWLDGTDR